MKALNRASWAVLAGLAGCVAACGSNAETGGGEQQRSVSSPIIGGYLDTTTKGVVALALNSHNQVSVICSGSLIAPNLVLTARHCIARIDDGKSEEVHCASSAFTAQYDPRQLYVSVDAQPETGDGDFYRVQEIREAPGSNQVCGYDLALLILAGSGIPASVATPIEPVLDDPTVAKETFAAVGYGLQDADDDKGQTAGTRMRFDSSTVYCVGNSCPPSAATSEDEWVGNSPVCSGDSGGPALDAKGRVFGVTSRGDSDCTYALYSNVANWAPFVRSTAQAAATAGGYAPLPWASGAADPGTAAGGSNATVDPTKPVAPTVGALGASCNADCPGAYQCYSATSMPPGICVPACTTSNLTCPDKYSCNTTLGVCTPAKVSTAHAEASCAVRAPSRSIAGAWALLSAVGFAWLGRRRRQRA